MSQIEALGLGVPVVVSNVGGLPETVQSGITGYVCPAPHAPAALEAWVLALGTVLAEPHNARAMAAQGRQAVLAQFGKPRNIDGLVGAVETPRLGRSCWSGQNALVCGLARGWNARWPPQPCWGSWRQSIPTQTG